MDSDGTNLKRLTEGEMISHLYVPRQANGCYFSTTTGSISAKQGWMRVPLKVGRQRDCRSQAPLVRRHFCFPMLLVMTRC